MFVISLNNINSDGCYKVSIALLNIVKFVIKKAHCNYYNRLFI